MGKSVPGSTPIEIERAVAATTEVRALIDELNQELAQHYAPEQRHGLALDAIFQPHIRFFVARIDGLAVGCGGVALFPDFGEIKRMYVRKESRGRGIADAIMQRLETEAVDAGLDLLRLETGVHSIAAIRFYGRKGFMPRDAFEPYSSMTSDAIATSVFLENKIASRKPPDREQ
jgi:putative acetyltransferase